MNTQAYLYSEFIDTSCKHASTIQLTFIKQQCTNHESVNDNGVLTSFSRQPPAQYCCQPAGFEGDPASHYCHLQTEKTIEMSN